MKVSIFLSKLAYDRGDYDSNPIVIDDVVELFFVKMPSMNYLYLFDGYDRFSFAFPELENVNLEGVNEI